MLSAKCQVQNAKCQVPTAKPTATCQVPNAKCPVPIAKRLMQNDCFAPFPSARRLTQMQQKHVCRHVTHGLFIFYMSSYKSQVPGAYCQMLLAKCKMQMPSATCNCQVLSMTCRASAEASSQSRRCKLLFGM